MRANLRNARDGLEISKRKKDIIGILYYWWHVRMLTNWWRDLYGEPVPD